MKLIFRHFIYVINLKYFDVMRNLKQVSYNLKVNKSINFIFRVVFVFCKLYITFVYLSNKC